jgi:hypothetical protein
VSALRWRPLEINRGAAGGGAVVVALVDRLFVHDRYRRRRVARTTLLKCLVDVLQQSASSGIPFSRVSVVLPEEPRLIGAGSLFLGLGFQRVGGDPLPADPTGMWGDRPGRTFVELALPVEMLLPLLNAAQAAQEGVRPAILRGPGAT